MNQYIPTSPYRHLIRWPHLSTKILVRCLMAHPGAGWSGASPDDVRRQIVLRERLGVGVGR